MMGSSMSNSLDKLNNQTIFISGTPCTGKTSISTKLNDYLISAGFNTLFIKINDLAIENDLVLGEDPDKFYKVIDIERLNDVLKGKIDNFLGSESESPRIAIAEGHLSHLCEGADKMIVLRLNPVELGKRLVERNYPESKIQENLEAEALAVCSAEAYEIYGERTCEIDTTNKSMDEVLDLVIKIICGELESPAGSVDFMDWFLI